MATDKRAGGAMFPTTRVSVVAGLRDPDRERASRSFARVVEAYGGPLYKHVRLKWRKGPEDARDLVQGFLATSFEKDYLAAFTPEKACFRAFLRTCVDRFVTKDAEAARAGRGLVNGLGDGVLSHLREVAAAADLSGTPYRFVRAIGRGGMGAVLLVEDGRLGRRVAMKVLDALGDEDLAARLEREARVIACLEHPNIVPVHDVGRLADGRVYYTMKYVRGERLDEWALGSPPRPAVMRTFQRVCEAVAFAHAQGVIHRDLKPQNIMVGAFGEALVMDWGLARTLPASGGARGLPKDTTGIEAPAGGALETGTLAGSALETGTLAGGALAVADTLPASSGGATRHGTVLGTPGYMAPEQVRGEIGQIDERADVFALGAILHFLLSGRSPFHADSAERALAATLHDEPPALRDGAPDVPRPLVSIALRALRKAPEERYASAREMAADVAAWLDGLPVSAHRETVPEKLARWYGRYQALVLLIVAYLLMRAVVVMVARR